MEVRRRVRLRYDTFFLRAWISHEVHREVGRTSDLRHYYRRIFDFTLEDDGINKIIKEHSIFIDTEKAQHFLQKLLDLIVLKARLLSILLVPILRERVKPLNNCP